MMTRNLILPALSIIVLSTACSHDTGLMRLEERLTSYGEAIRWSRFELASDFQTPRAHSPTPIDVSKDIHVTGYDPVYRHESEDGKTVNQTVELSYFREQTGIVKQLTDRQTWTFDGKKGQWFLDSPLPDFSK